MIFGADVFAAFVAIKLFEARHADRERMEKSLSRLHQITNGLHGFYFKQRGKINSIADRFEASISGDLNDERIDFEHLNDDLLFWSFKAAQPFRIQYDIIRNSISTVHSQQNAAELRNKLNNLIGELKTLTESIAKKLKPEKERWIFLGKLQRKKA